MNQPVQTGQRIVSKGEYIKAHLHKSGLSVIGLITIVIFGTSMVIVPMLVLAFIVSHINILVAGVCLLLTIFYCVAAWHIGKAGEKLVNQAAEMDTGVPLTRANTADLPAPDSLVRASEEPVQEQESVLLRAAMQVEERHEEQLVHPIE